MNQERNLINSVTVPLPSSIEGRPAGFYKSIILDVLSIVSAFSVGYAYRQYLAVGMSPLAVVGTFLIFGVLSALQALLCKSAGRRAFIVLCEVAMFGLFFYALDWRFLLAAVACAFLLFFFGYLGSRSEIEYGMEIRLFRTTKRVIGKVMTGTIIFMIVIYIPLWNQNSVFIPQKSFDAFFDWGAGVINIFSPKISLSGSLGNFVNDIARVQLENAASFQELSLKNQNTLVTQGAASIIDNISKSTGIAVQPQDTLSATAYRFIIKTLGGWENRFQGMFFAVWGVVLFFVARSVGIIVVWIDQFLFFFVYEILLAFRFMRVKEESRTKEIVEYSGSVSKVDY